MKKTVITLSTMFVCATAHAVPTGCFVTDTDNYCYAGSFSYSDCDQWDMSAYYFGNYISSMCNYVNSTESLAITLSNSLDSCNRDFNTVVAQRNVCLSEKGLCLNLSAQVEANRQEWVGYAQKRDALIKKLYRACGTKCKRIK